MAAEAEAASVAMGDSHSEGDHGINLGVFGFKGLFSISSSNSLCWDKRANVSDLRGSAGSQSATRRR